MVTADRRPSDSVADRHSSNDWRELAIGTLFASGLLAALVRLRRRRLAQRRPGFRIAPPPQDVAETETVLRAEADPDRMRAFRFLIGDLAGRVRLEGANARVRAAQLTDDGVELLWTEPQPRPPKPWTTANSGWSWSASWPDPLAVAERAPVLPTLVPLGVRENGEELLLDLEAIGSLSLDGDPALVSAFARQLAVAASVNPLGDNVDVVAVEFDVPAATHLENVRKLAVADAVHWSTVRATEVLGALARSSTDSVLGARLLGRSEEWEPLVVVALGVDAQTTEKLVQTAIAGSGVVAVLAGASGAADRVVLHSTDKAEWVGGGVMFDPCLLTESAGSDLAALFEHVEEADEHAVVLHDVAPPPTESAAPDPVDATPAPPAYDVLVRVLGEVVVEGCVDHLTEAEVELVALLATMRPDGPVNIDRLATLLAHDEWRTPKTRSIQARISHLRRKLGVGSDGAPLLPDSRTATGNPNRYLVSPRVVTDVDLLDDAYKRSLGLPSSEAIDALRTALGLVRGRPYTAKVGYSWAYDEHAVSRSVQVVGDVASRLIELYGEANDVAAVRAVIDRASKAMDDPMAEVSYRLAERQLREQAASSTSFVPRPAISRPGSKLSSMSRIPRPTRRWAETAGPEALAETWTTTSWRDWVGALQAPCEPAAAPVIRTGTGCK